MKKSILALLLCIHVFINASDAARQLTNANKTEWNVPVGSSLYYRLFPLLPKKEKQKLRREQAMVYIIYTGPVTPRWSSSYSSTVEEWVAQVEKENKGLREIQALHAAAFPSISKEKQKRRSTRT